MITFQLESPDIFLRDGKALLEEHHAELGEGQLQLDVRTYNFLWNSGQLMILTAREEGRMIGYLVVAVRPHLHFADTLVGFADALFLERDSRKGMLGVKLVKEGLRVLKNAGVKKFCFFSMRQKSLAPLFERLGFEPEATIYSKDL